MDKRLLMPNRLAQFRLNYLGPEGDVNNNILYVRRQTGCITSLNQAWSDDAAAAMARVFAEAWRDHLKVYVTPRCVLQSVDWVWNESIPDGPLHEGTYLGTPLPQAGTGTGGDMPAGMTLAVRLLTGLGGRSNHGRFFLPPPLRSGLATVDPNAIDAASQGNLQTDVTAWLAQVNWNTCVAGIGDKYDLVVASFVHNGAVRAEAQHHSVTGIGFKDFFLDFQRRRAPAHARHH